MSASMRAASRRAKSISRAGKSARAPGPARLRGPARAWGPARQAIGLLTVAAASVGVVTAAAVVSAQPAGPRTTATAAAHARTGTSATAAARTGTAPNAAAATLAPQASRAAQVPEAPLVLTARDRESCPPAATACVDLTEHLTWLQAGGKVSFGPVRMEPGPPGTPHATPRGTFQVSWKAGPHFVSNIYGDPMPWAVFFAPGGIAFHGGSLTTSSHGCVHLTVPNARYYNAHLPIGAQVVVF
jgi:lipoprotein-anchoring transpeptidase ErfK/SrfK